jgi:hypothetical protein
MAAATARRRGAGALALLATVTARQRCGAGTRKGPCALCRIRLHDSSGKDESEGVLGACSSRRGRDTPLAAHTLASKARQAVETN